MAARGGAPVRFGTDGIRGDAESEINTAVATAVGRAAARVLGVGERFVIGCDTRESSARIVLALGAGLVYERAHVDVVGVLPTPGVAFLAQQRDVPALMVSASHNPWTDNGIKLFARGGLKLGDEQQARVEAEIDAVQTRWREVMPAPALPAGDADASAYPRHLVGALDGRRLDGLRVVLDCANGAAYEIAPAVFRALGASIEVIGASPNGRNINDGCGSNHPEALQRAVVDARADLGLAFDGDADRCVAVDGHGGLVDGDQVMYALAVDLHARGALPGDAVVVTVMSNLGLRRALAGRGIATVETPVGDRHVLAALEEHGAALGGEQSGHIICRALATTGDGVLTGLLLSDLVVRRATPLDALVAPMQRLPQVLVNVRLGAPFDLAGAESVWAVVRAIEAELGDGGRVLVRASGTEPLVRVMVEAPTDTVAHQATARVRAAVEHAASSQPA